MTVVADNLVVTDNPRVVNWRLRQLAKSWPARIGGALLLALVLVAMAAPLIAPDDPSATGLGRSLAGPSVAHPAGLDKLGRDVLSRVIWGARISLFTGVGSVAIAIVFGGLVGTLAGGLGGRVDSVLMRIVDVLLAVPGILLAIGIVAWLGQGLPQIMLAVGVSNAPIFARLLRGSLLALSATEFVLAARSLGAGRGRIIVRHLLPNSLTPLVVAATLAMGTAIIDVAGLGFLGLGPPDPRTPEWGTMLTDATELLRRAPHVVFAPAVCIVLAVLAFNLLGDAVRESLDPQMKR
jgi:peptide/nickel transport system permease protein